MFPDIASLPMLALAAVIGFVLGRATAGGPEERARRKANDRLRIASAAAGLAPDTRAQIKALVAEGRTIEAIKTARQALGLDLKDAKGLVDSLRATAP